MTLDVSGDGLEVRVLFQYRSGAIDPITMSQHAWKSTPVIDSLKVSFLERSRVLSREVLR